MKGRPALLVFLLGSALVIPTFAQKPATRKAPAPQAKKPAQKADTVSPNQKFVLDVVRSAVALPQSDPQDRLRVLYAAASVVSPIKPALSRQLSREGLRIEQELIQSGQTPAISLLNMGHVDCAVMSGFIENVPDDKVMAAEQSIIGAITLCPKESIEPARRKIESAMAAGVVAPRALMALMEAVGPKTPWAEQNFGKLFSSLPADAEAYRAEAPNFAAMYSRMAPEVSKDAAKSAGVRMLVWLGKLQDSGERNLALNIVTDSMKEALGPKGYEEALASDVMARQAAQSAGQPGEVEHEDEENVSVLQAIQNRKTDRTADLQQMPASLRAREAAASGFATGTDGNRKQADKYFDIAFAALNDVWDNRNDRRDAPSVVEEVSEAAAQVDAVDALKRAQGLQDPSARAIGMLAVARVVAGQGNQPAAKQ